jgi:ankyrin repeat protein
MAAAEQGSLAIVQSLLDKGANVDAKSNNGVTALIAAAAKRYPRTVQSLLDNGADVDTKDKYGRTALMVAAARGCFAMVQLLLDKGAKVVGTDENKQVLPLLLHYGIKLEAVDNRGCTALNDSC